MKSGNEDNNKEGLAVVNEAVNEIAGAVIAAHANSPAFSAEKQDLEDIAEVVIGAMNVLEKSNSLQNITAKDIKGLEEKAESLKSRSSIGTQIKAWFKSWFTPLINFLKSPFSKQHKEELQQATKDAVQGIDVIQKQAVQEQVAEKQISPTIPAKEAPMQPPLVEASKPQSAISKTAPLAVPEITHPIQDVGQEHALVSNTPTMPPAQVTNITPTVMPPPVQVVVNNGPGVPPPPPPPPPPAYVAPQDPLVALKGMKKKSAEEIEKLANPAGTNMLHELEKKLAARRDKAGEVQSNTKLPEVFLKDKAEFERLRAEEAARQAKQDEIDAPRIAAALKAEAEKQAASTKIPSVTFDKSGVPMPPPPPPPPPMLGTTGIQLSKPAVKSPTADKKVQTKPAQLAVDAKALENAMGNFRKVASSPPKKTTETPVPNFKANLKPTKGHGGR
ncbi:hypothetical protein [Candidatus Tisiphia endosymbiont of Oplodontha viridula]|uniref:hypothetical protein n=1 Tax=Candidatus Tisiphia endosymbiont of Oplodontha viridula TaxID=3077925 RepID=UPI0035C90ED6